MSFFIKMEAQRWAMPELTEECATKANYVEGLTNATIGINAPRGVLGGSVAAISATAGDYKVEPGNGKNVPVGIFMEGYVAPAVYNIEYAPGSNKCTVCKGMPSAEVDVFETNAMTVDGTGKVTSGAALTYAVGDELYCSPNGFLTNQKPSEAYGDGAGAKDIVIAICTKAPTTSDLILGFDQRI